MNPWERKAPWWLGTPPRTPEPVRPSERADGLEFGWTPSEGDMRIMHEESARWRRENEQRELRTRCAWHEAAHCWAALSCDLPISEVTVSRNGNGHTQPAIGSALDIRFVAVLLAGAEGERLRYGSAKLGRDDNRLYDDMRDGLRITDSEDWKFRQFATHLVECGRRPIGALAESLLRHGTLRGQEAVDILTAHADGALYEVVEREEARNTVRAQPTKEWPAFLFGWSPEAVDTWRRMNEAGEAEEWEEWESLHEQLCDLVPEGDVPIVNRIAK